MSREYPHPLPEDAVLAAAAQALEDGRFAGEVLDERWRLVYVSSELRNLLGYHEDEQLAYGRNTIMRGFAAPEVWRLSEVSQRLWWQRDGRFMRADLPAEPDWIDEEFGSLAGAFKRLDPAVGPIAWADKFTTDSPGEEQGRMTVGRLVVRLRREGGAQAGILGVYVGGGLRGSIQTMLSRGDVGMFERMAVLTDPDRRPAAVLFADLEASGELSRRLSTHSYFALIRELTTTIDRAVVEGAGIVGKHVGDGVSAFFLAEQCGGEHEAAASAVNAAASIRDGVATLGPGGDPLHVNVGLHWGATLVIGQIVTGGRLEVTALGDEVNEAARLQEVAQGGVTLASKDLIERLPTEAAADLGIDLTATEYEILGQLPGVTDKARRDAGGLAVSEILAAPGD